MNDLQHPSSNINKLIAKFQLQNPEYEEQIISSKLDMLMFYDFTINHMPDFEYNLRANAMINLARRILHNMIRIKSWLH